MLVLNETRRLRIEAPTAELGFVLERRLAYLRPTLVGHGDSWLVELEDDADRVDEIVATVRHWLRDEGLAETLVHIDGTTRHVRAPKSRTASTTVA